MRKSVVRGPGRPDPGGGANSSCGAGAVILDYRAAARLCLLLPPGPPVLPEPSSHTTGGLARFHRCAVIGQVCGEVRECSFFWEVNPYGGQAMEEVKKRGSIHPPSLRAQGVSPIAFPAISSWVGVKSLQKRSRSSE